MATDEEIERAREEREEEEYERSLSAVSVPDIRTPFVSVKSTLVRDWVRAALVPAAVQRLYEIGMGVTRFSVPTMAGNTVRVPAPAAVQTRALQGIISIGVPQQLGLASDGDELPGVIAVGEWELAGARGEVHEQHASSQSIAGALGAALGEGEGVAQGAGESPKLASESSSLSAPAYVPPEGHEVVVVEEHETTNDTRAEQEPPPADPLADPRIALAREFLERRRASRNGTKPHDGPKPGDHPNHT